MSRWEWRGKRASKAAQAWHRQTHVHNMVSGQEPTNRYAQSHRCGLLHVPENTMGPVKRLIITSRRALSEVEQIKVADATIPAKVTMENVWFVDVVTSYGPACLHSAPVHMALEQCTEFLNAKYIAVADQKCPTFRGTEKWLRIFRKQEPYYTSFAVKLTAFFELWIRTRSLLKAIDNNACYIIIHLDWANLNQILALWLSAASLEAARNKSIIWVHFDRSAGWQEKKIGRFVRSIFARFPIKLWGTAYTSEIASENSKCGWFVDKLPLPLNPALNAFTYNPKSTNQTPVINAFRDKADRLVCWLVVGRPEHGLELLPRIISHKSAKAFSTKFIKCFVREMAVTNIKENCEIELVRLPFFSEEDYKLYFNQCEVVLLPYNPQLFGSAMSMVFIEAVATSKIVIVSEGTAMANELRRFDLRDLVMDFNNDFSWTLIDEIRKDNSIRTRLNVMAESYVREHDAFGCAQSLYKGLKRINSKIPLSDPKLNFASLRVGA